MNGTPTYYAGGGGGGVYYTAATPGLGGTGGGGAGGDRDQQAVAGTDGLGGGGGGGGDTVSGGFPGKAGGKGIVIIRYLTAQLANAYNTSTGWAGSNSVLDPSCLVGDGMNDSVDWGDLAPCDFATGPFTVRSWIKFAAAPSVTVPIVAKLSGSQGWSLRLTAARKIEGYVGESGTNYRTQTGATVLAVDTWYHVTMTYGGSGNDITLYLGGLPETMTAAGSVGAWNLSSTGKLQFFKET
jgi:hypothetical protein